MSKKSHRKQVARAKAKREQNRFERRAARNRMIILIMAVLMGLSLFAIPLTQWLAGRGEASVPEPEDTDPLAELDDLEPAPYDEPFELTIDPAGDYTAVIATDAGDITLQLHAAEAPNTVNNLVNLAQDDYFDGIIFHRVIDGFVIQGGDPTGTGMGGPGYRIDDELELAQQIAEEHGGYPRGTLAMANSGPNTNGSQFFIVQGEVVPLEPNFTIFGEVVDGMDVVDAIATAETGEFDRPVDPVAIQTVEIVEG